MSKVPDKKPPPIKSDRIGSIAHEGETSIFCRFGRHKWALPKPFKAYHLASIGVWVYCERCGVAGINTGPLLGVRVTQTPFVEVNAELKQIHEEGLRREQS